MYRYLRIIPLAIALAFPPTEVYRSKTFDNPAHWRTDSFSFLPAVYSYGFDRKRIDLPVWITIISSIALITFLTKKERPPKEPPPH